jgi:tryptophan synthase alpha chain
MRGIYLVAGYPDENRFMESFRAVEQAGFDFVEIGIPFNDPIADGPVIARAIHEALAGGATPGNVMKNIRSLHDSGIKKYAMTYANVIYSIGPGKFSDEMAGILSGVIVPDLPNRMARRFYEGGLGIPVVPFATLETRPSDIDLINGSESEILYFVGVRGITGSAGNLDSPELLDKIKMLKAHTSKKIIIGFGIKTKNDADRALEIGDGFVVGTEAVRRQKNPGELKDYLRSLL